MRSPKRRAPNQAANRDGQPGSGVNSGDHERLGGIKVGQKANQTIGQHGFARSWWPDHQQVVATGGTDLQGPTSHRLASNVGQVRGLQVRQWRLGRL